MRKPEKIEVVKDVTEQLKNAAAAILVDYTGTSVKMQQELKNRLREAGAEMTVVKNTLLKRAGKEAKLPEDALTDTVLSGQTALIISKEEPIAPLQVLAKFAKEFEVPQLKVGLVEGVFQNKETLTKLSTLPSKEVLYAQVVGAIAAPMYGIVSTLQGNLQKLIYILDTKVKSES